MSKLEMIQEKILELTQADINVLDTWLNELRQASWDEELVDDLEAGRLDGLINEALENYNAGRISRYA